MDNKINLLAKKMIEFNSGDPKRIQHALKVLKFCEIIGDGEDLPEGDMFVLRAAAVLHDIGIRVCEEKYGSCTGKQQEEEGPKIALGFMEGFGFPEDVKNRVCYLIGHHHTYNMIDGKDYQILVEADFLVNLYEGNLPFQSVKSVYEKIFKTKTGKEILKQMFKL